MDVSLLLVNLSWILTIVASILTILLCWQVLVIHKYWKKRGVPYDTPLPFIGNLGFLMRKSVWEFFDDLKKRHPSDCVGLFMGSQPALVVQTPELARQVLVKDFENFQDRYVRASPDDPIGALNLFTVKNPIWSSMRHEISPMFTSARLKLLTQLMNINAQQLVQRIQKDYIDNNLPINLKELFTMYTSDTVGYTVFGLRVSSLSGQDSPLWTITSHMVKWTLYRGIELHCIFFLPFLAKLMRLAFFSKAATEYIKQLFWSVVKERQISKTTNDKDLVHLLLKLKENLKLPAGSDAQLADNLMLAQAGVFIFGSVDTSSSTLSYALIELARHPDEQEKLFNEIKNAMEENGKEVLEYNDLVELKYLSACINETLRKHPPVAYVERKCNNPYSIGGITVERGTPVLVNVVGIHHDPRHWPEPDKWDPERPVAANDNDNIDSTFLPFGDGPRFCIGKRYGMMQIRAALAQMVLAFRLEPVDTEVAPDPYSIFLAPKSGGRVKFVKR